jgi:hypothetical protein
MRTPDDLPLAAHLALTDYLHELRRQEIGVKPVNTPKPATNPFAVPVYEDTGLKTTPQASTKVKKIEYGEHEAPAIAYVRSLGIDAQVSSQVAEELGVSVQLVRKLRTSGDFKAPSLEVPFGKNKIFLYTPEDVEELRAYVQRSRTPRPRS